VETFGISERRVCGLLDVWRSSRRYQQKPDRNRKLRDRSIPSLCEFRTVIHAQRFGDATTFD
jgi:hypothetical protein